MQPVAAAPVLHLHHDPIPVVLREGERPIEIIVGGSATAGSQKAATQSAVDPHLAVIIGAGAQVRGAGGRATVVQIHGGVSGAIVLGHDVVKGGAQQINNIVGRGGRLPLGCAVRVPKGVSGGPVGRARCQLRLVHRDAAVSARD